MPKRGLPDTLRMRHDAHYVETLAASAGDAGRPDGAHRPDRPQPRPAAPGDGRPVRAHRVGHRKGDHRAAGRAPARRALPDHRRRAPLPRRRPGRPPRAAGGRPRRRRDRNAGARPGREHPAQGPDPVRRSRGAAQPGDNAAATPTRTWPSAWASRARRSPSRCRCTPCRRRCARCAGWPGIAGKSVLLQIVRQGDAQKMLALVEKIASQGGATREQVRKETQKPKAGRPKSFTFNFKPPSKAFNLRLSFNKRTRRRTRSSTRSKGFSGN